MQTPQTGRLNVTYMMRAQSQIHTPRMLTVAYMFHTLFWCSCITYW